MLPVGMSVKYGGVVSIPAVVTFTQYSTRFAVQFVFPGYTKVILKCPVLLKLVKFVSGVVPSLISVLVL